MAMTAGVSAFLFENPNFQLYSGEHSFIGHIEVNDEFYQIQIVAPNFPSPSGISCRVSKGILSIPLVGFESTNSKTITNYLKLLYEFLHTQKLSDQTQISVDTIGTFLDQLKSMYQGRRCKVLINQSYNAVKLTNFEAFEGHYLELKVSAMFEVTVEKHSLPDKDSTGNVLFSAKGSLETVTGQFWRLLEQFAEFYGHLNTIDELCTVVEPVKVTTKHDWRIFRITEKVLGKILVDPFVPSAITLNFIGPTPEVEKYRKIYNENIHRWDIDLDVYRNLLRIFDVMYFPMRGSQQESEEKYCNICYMYMLDDHIPLISCDNPRCDLLFHIACLKRWFARLKDGKTFLAVTFGSCPLCKEKLSTSFVQLLDV